MIFAKEPYQKVGDKFRIPCAECIDGFAVVDLIINEDAVRFTDNINVMDGAFTIVDHSTEYERTVYPFNNYGRWVWASNANSVNEDAAKELVDFINKRPKNTENVNEEEQNFFNIVEKAAIEGPIFSIGIYNEFIEYNNGENPIENIPGAIVGCAFALWLKNHNYDKDIKGFIDLMRKW